MKKVKKLLKKCTVLLLTAAMSITALPVTAWAETPAESVVMGAETATDHVDETEQEMIENSEEVEQVETAPAESEDAGEDENQAASTEQRLNYMYIDQPYLETPNTQKVVVSWGDGSEGIEQMTATVQGPVGEEVWTAAQETDDIYLFERAYTEQERGVYSVTELHVTIAGIVYDYSLTDLGVEARFGVDEEYEGMEELQPVSEEEVAAGVAAYKIDESGNVTEQSSIEEAIVQAEQEIPAMMSDDGVQAQSSNIVVALDPGHDSTHAGASANGVREEVLTLKIAQYCKAELEEYAGVSVYMTRTTADCPHPGGSSAHDIDQRVADAAAAGASVYVSFHLNSSLSSAAKGAEIIIPNTNWKPQVGNDGKKLATLIESELVGLGLEERKIYSKDTTVNERYEDGSLSDYFTVQISAKEHGIPGIIVEHAFVTNTSDVNNFLNNEAGLKKLGVADATGIAKYFGLSKGQWFQNSKGWWYAAGTSCLKNQWAQINGNGYYFDSNGYMLTGWQELEGKWYYFGGANDGVMRIDWQKIGNSWYYFGGANDGAMRTGWQKFGPKWYYFNEKGEMLTGWQKIENGKYYFDVNGVMSTNWQKVGNNWYYFGGRDDGVMKTDWLLLGNTWYYLGNDGVMVTDWKKFGPKWYYFGGPNDGAMKTDWQKFGQKWYYFEDCGVMCTGWRKFGRVWYYFGSLDDGVMRTGWQSFGKNWYYFGTENEGAMRTGWQKVWNLWYYFGGADDGVMTTGWKTLGKDRYFFGAENDGVMRTGWQKLDGKWHYFGTSDDGKMKTSWLQTENLWYYLDPDDGGAMSTGWRTYGTDRYYFGLENDGVMRTGWQKVDGKWYYFGTADDGKMKTDWIQLENNWYYLNPNENGAMASDWTKIDGRWYYFDENGVYDWRKTYAENGPSTEQKPEIDSDKNNGNETGSDKNNGNLDSSDKNNSNVNTDKGNTVDGTYLIEGSTEVTVDQMVSYFKKSKKMYPEEVMGKGGAATIKDFCQIYYEEAEKEGIKAEVAFAQAMKETGWLQFTGVVKAEQYNFAGMGATGNGVAGETFKDVREGVRAQIQHLKAYGSTKPLNQVCVDNRFKYVERGSAIYVEWLGIPNNPNKKGWAAADGYGVDIVQMIQKMKTLQTSGENQNYFQDRNGNHSTGWLQKDRKWYYLDPEQDGAVFDNGWKQINSEWYYFKDGVMQTGWLKYGNSWYCLAADGYMYVNGWAYINSEWYYFNKDGVMQTGWQKYGNTWYYLATDGYMYVNGWGYIDSRWYYFNKDGVMQVGWVLYGNDWYYLYPANNPAGMPEGVMAVNTAINGYAIAPDGVNNEAYQGAYNVLNQVGWNLWSAYNWSANLPYVNYSNDPLPGSKNFAIHGFQTNTGDCYVMAATFYYMAKMLGYDAHQIAGYVPLRGGGQGVHSWVEIDMDGATYVFDPDFTHETKRNGYQITYGMSGTWRYSNYSRMN